MAIKISTESSIVIPNNYREKYGIEVMPLHIIYGEESFDDAVDITAEDIISRAKKTGELPTTSACSIGEYAAFFRQLTADGSELVHFSMSSGISSTYRNACIAAEDIPGVHVVDTLNITSGAGLLVIKAAEMARTGYSAKEIVRRAAENRDKIRCSFILDTLDFLKKGGRCSGVVAFGANVLGIKPVIEMRDGKMQVGKKFRGKFSSCALKYVGSCFEGCVEPDVSRAVIEYSPGVDEKLIDEIRKEIKKNLKFDEVIDIQTTSTIVAHCGPGTFGIMFMLA